MKNCKFLLIQLSLSFLFFTHIYAQEKLKARLADSYFDKYSFTNAASLYEDLATKNDKNIHYVSRAAECYKLTGNTVKAEVWYAKLIGMENSEPIYILYYAEMLESNKKYEEAQKYYNLYAQKSNKDSRAQRKISTQEQIQKLIKDTSWYIVFNHAFNSENSDFGLFPFNDSIYFFVSGRKNEKYVNHVYNWNNKPFLDIYSITKKNNGAFSSPVFYSSAINSKYHEGPVFIDRKDNTMYVTRNNYIDKKFQKSQDGVNKLKLYIVRTGNDQSANITEFEYNNNEYSIGHACLNNKGEKLYFSSDMPGGFGGADLYVSEKEGDKWGKPQNLGPVVNTEGNEMFPFVSENNILYFSSDGHFGLGGLDIYSFALKNNAAHPVNMKAPINSNKDDFAFNISQDDLSGSFASNRDGGKGDDDIYTFKLVKPLYSIIKGIVINEKNNQPVPFAQISVSQDIASGKTDVLNADSFGNFSYNADLNFDYIIQAGKENYSIDRQNIITDESKDTIQLLMKIHKNDYVLRGQVLNKENAHPVSQANVFMFNNTTGEKTNIISDTNGFFAFVIKPEQAYSIHAEKIKYLKNSIDLSTQTLSEDTVHRDILLDELVAGKTFTLANIYYDLNKWDIRNDAAVELDKLVRIMQDNPTMKIELGSHTDSRASDGYNLSLSDKRAKSAAGYIISKGVEKNRIKGKGYGETKLLNKCFNNTKCSEEEHQQNRRTEFKILFIK